MTEDILASIEPPSIRDFVRAGVDGPPLVIDPSTGRRVRYRRSSSAGKVLDDESNLEDWKRRTAIIGAAFTPANMALVSTLDPERDKKELRRIVEECIKVGKGKERAVQGKAVHSMFDHVDLDHDWTPAPQFADIVRAYVLELEYFGLVPIDVEVQCVCDKYRLAGTLDRRYLTTRALLAPDGVIIPIGSVIVGDTKTGRSLEYTAGTYTTQLTAYIESMRYDVDTDERTPFDPPSYPNWGIIVHAIPEQSKVNMYWADIERGRIGLALANEVWNWRRSTDLLTPAVPPLRAVPPPVEPQEPRNEAEPPSIAEEPSALVEAPVREWLRERVVAIIEGHSEGARKQLQRLWPKGMPGFKNEGQTIRQCDELELVLNRVEADFNLSFGPSDPRKNHPSRRIRHRPLLVQVWLREMLISGQMDLDRTEADNRALMECLEEFSRMGDEWSDDDLTIMLRGSLMALGYEGGISELGRITQATMRDIGTAAFAIQSGTAMLLYDDQDRPVVRFNVITADRQTRESNEQ